MTIIEFLQEYDKGCEGMLDSGEQSVYFSLLLIWNRLRRPEWFSVSRTELMRKSGVGDVKRVDRLRVSLERKGFIETSGTGRTTPRKYHLKELPTRGTEPLTRVTKPLEAKGKVPLENSTRGTEPLHWGHRTPTLGAECPTSQRQSNTEYDSSPSQDTNSNLVSIEREIPPPKLPVDVLETYHGFNPTPTLTETDKLAIWSEEYGTRAVKIAIETAIEAGAHHINYIRSILQNGGGAGNERPKRNARRTEKEDPDKWHKAAERQRKFEERMRAQYGEGWNLPEVPCGDF